MNEHLQRVSLAINSNNVEQKRIAEVGVEWIDLLLRKNADYGSAIFTSPILIQKITPQEAILVRMSDKINRLVNLLNSQNEGLVNESISDTIKDLGAYCLLMQSIALEESNEDNS